MDTELGLEPLDAGEDLWWLFYLPSPHGIETLAPLRGAFQRIGLRVVDQYVSAPHFRLRLHDDEAALHLRVSSGNGETAYVRLGMYATDLLPPEGVRARANADRCLEYAKVGYAVLRPVYGFAESLNLYVERADVAAARLTHVCWAQLFGPAFVDGAGRTLLANAPARRNENLSDGGLRYVLAASPYLAEGPRQHWDAAREYFAARGVRPGYWSHRPG